MRVEPGGAHLVVIGVEAADQAPPGGDDLAVIERDLDALAADRLAFEVERDEFQPQIVVAHPPAVGLRSEEQTSELQYLMRIAYAGFCCKNTKIIRNKATQVKSQN